MEVGVGLRAVPGDARARAALEEARAIAEATLQSVRDMSQLLHPSTLDDFGLPETLTAYVSSFSKRSGIRAQFSCSGLGARLPADVEVCVYRIVQEALTNVARHSGAEQCSVELTLHDGNLCLAIEDTGCGPDRPAAGGVPQPRGLGVIAMRERDRKS